MDNMEMYYYDEDFVDDDDIVDAELEALTEGTDIVLPDDPAERRKLRDELIRNPPPPPAPKGGPDVSDDSFYGLELNSVKKGRMMIADNLTNYLAKTEGVEVYSRADGNPFKRSAVIGLKLERVLLRGDAAKAFRSLVSLCDKFYFTTRGETVMFALSITNVWDSWREATPEEIEAYENSFSDD